MKIEQQELAVEETNFIPPIVEPLELPPDPEREARIEARRRFSFAPAGDYVVEG